MAVASSSIPERAVNGHRPARVPPDEPAPAAANETERALLAAARAGDFFDPLGSTAPTSEVATGWGGGSVRARFLVALLTSPDAGVHRLGVRATGIRITETLDLRAAKLLVPLDLNGCRLTRGPRLDDASGSFIAVRGCTVTHGGLEAARLHLDGSLDLSRTSFRSRVSLHDAHIGADLICHHTRFRRGASTEALYAPGITVDADVLLDGSTATGCVDLSQARIERSLHARCVSYSCRTGPAMRLRGVHVGGEVDCAGATVSAPVDAIEARGLEAGIVSFDPCFDEKLTDGAPRAMTARGCLSFRHATITAFRARGACLRRPAAAAHRDREQALNLTGAKVAGDVDLGP